MTDRIRKIANELRDRAITERATILARLGRGAGYDKIGYHLFELDRDIKAYSEQLGAKQ